MSIKKKYSRFFFISRSATTHLNFLFVLQNANKKRSHLGPTSHHLKFFKFQDQPLIVILGTITRQYTGTEIFDSIFYSMKTVPGQTRSFRRRNKYKIKKRRKIAEYQTKIWRETKVICMYNTLGRGPNWMVKHATSFRVEEKSCREAVWMVGLAKIRE